MVLFLPMVLKKSTRLCTFLSILQDALRLYIINSPVVRAEPLRFKKDGVYGVVSIMFSFGCHIFGCFTGLEYFIVP